MVRSVMVRFYSDGRNETDGELKEMEQRGRGKKKKNGRGEMEMEAVG